MLRAAHTVPLLAAVTALAQACHEPPSLTSCAEPLGGVWDVADGSGRAFDVLDTGDTVELFPMWDTSRPLVGEKPILHSTGAAATGVPYASPLRIALRRAGDAVAGESSFRMTGAGMTCLVSSPARLTACSGRSAVLTLRPQADVDLGLCTIARGGFVDVTIRRRGSRNMPP